MTSKGSTRMNLGLFDTRQPVELSVVSGQTSWFTGAVAVSGACPSVPADVLEVLIWARELGTTYPWYPT
jgi:hypothetical protein